MSNPPFQDQTLAQARLVQAAVVKIGGKALAVSIFDFVLIRILGPNLVNLHQDWALAASIACVALAVLATGWLAFQLWIDLRRFHEARRQLRRTSLKVETK